MEQVISQVIEIEEYKNIYTNYFIRVNKNIKAQVFAAHQAHEWNIGDEMIEKATLCKL